MKEDFVSSQNISIRYDVKNVISLCFFSLNKYWN